MSEGWRRYLLYRSYGEVKIEVSPDLQEGLAKVNVSAAVGVIQYNWRLATNSLADIRKGCDLHAAKGEEVFEVYLSSVDYKRITAEMDAANPPPITSANYQPPPKPEPVKPARDAAFWKRYAGTT